jgi:hypothetical protein
MNTYIWGPPLWRLIHSVAYCAKSEHADELALFFLSFKKVLPCIYCRKSFEEFEQILVVQHGNKRLGQIIQDNELFAWSYALHDLVNKKLDKQEFEKQMVTTTCLRAKQLSFECLQKRHKLHPVNVTVTDLFDILFIFALNYPEDPQDEELLVKRQAYKQFLLRLPLVVHICIKYGDPLIALRYDPLLRFQKAYMMFTSDNLSRTVLDSRKNLFCAILIVWAAYYRHDITSRAASKELYNNMMQRYSVAKAKACKHGACF